MEADITTLYHHLSSQAQTLLAELDAFTQHIQSLPQPPHPSIPLTKFRADIAREAKQLEQHGRSLTPSTTGPNPPTPGNTIHQIRSSNITHLSSIWAVAKLNAGLTGIRKQVRYTTSTPPPAAASASANPTPSSKASSHARQRSRIYERREATAQRNGGAFAVPRSDKEHVTVDVVADHGAKWIKVFTKNQRWLMMDLAKEGLVDIAGDSESDVDTDVDYGHDQLPAQSTGNSYIPRSDGTDKNSALEEVKLVKMAREFVAASKTTRVAPHRRHPAIYFHLPKIEWGVSADVDAVLSHMERIGIVITTSHNGQSPTTDDPPLPLPTIFTHMTAPPPPHPLTQTLNIDCTLLIALVSDISHFPRSHIAIPHHYDGRPSKKDIEGQMASEEQGSLLEAIYPILRGRRLVCTRTAVEHLQGIIRIMGSASETARSHVLLGWSDGATVDMLSPKDADARRAFQEMSVHAVPSDLMLPIQVVDDGGFDGFGTDEHPTALDAEVMQRIAKLPRLSPLNRSVFLYGWREGLTTISLNRVVTEWLERAVNGALDEIEWESATPESGSSRDIAVEDGFVGPKVVVCGRERSLLGNEKRGNHSRAEDDGD